MTIFFVRSPAFDQVHFAERRVAGSDVMVKACCIQAQSLADRLFSWAVTHFSRKMIWWRLLGLCRGDKHPPRR